MSRTSDQLFESITTEGALLPSDFLNRLAQRDSEIPGLTPDAYHLGSGEKLNEAISRSWNRVLGVWKSFAPAMQSLPASDAGTTLTREKWLLPLFQELGYGRLQTAKPFEFEGRKYSISHGWLNTPIHLVSFRAKLDDRSENIIGARTTSPHSMVQEFLNRSAPHVWGVISNGLTLRLLRDNVSLTRQAFVEFDLEAMMQGELYADFSLLWLLLHQSRVEGERAELCWLEKWTQEARQRGARALDQLRVGVQDAISALGSGFLSHAANASLRDKLTTGVLTKQDYFRQLLRVVYRFLFLFAAEDRDLLHKAEANDAPEKEKKAAAKSKETYRLHYSAARLRRIANRLGGTQHADLWHNVRLVFTWLSSDEGCPALGLPALGSFLWSARATPDLDDCFIANRDLLAAIRALAFVDHNKVRRPIDYKNIGTEEIGSVYESLLEQHPDVHIPTAKFTLGTHAGNERKTSGTHYTPPSLVNCLLDSALEPVLQERERDFAKLGFKSAEEALLGMKVCDEACGSGHFLIGAAHRMAKRLAAIRTGDGEPAPAAVRHALRDVIGRCLYGVDINPMAVELCKFALWLEALEPGKPLSFLDHHIQCGNALLGATPALMAQGIPDAAFEPIEGDDKKYCTNFKKENRKELRQDTLFDRHDRPWEHLGNLSIGIAQLASLPDNSVADVHAKEKIYAELVRSSSYESGRQLADAWCAAFVWKKCPVAAGGFDYPITNDIFQKLERNPHDAPSWMRDEIKRLAGQYQFFHWHLAYPDVFRVPGKDGKSENQLSGLNGGFDAILGNPPWDKIQPEEDKFFASVRPDIAHAKSAKVRKDLIEELPRSDSALNTKWLEHKRHIQSTCHFIKSSGAFPLSGDGNLNAYRNFTELTLSLLSPAGRAGTIVQAGLATDETGKELFAFLMEGKHLISFLSFENKRGFFVDVHAQFRFCLLTIGGANTFAQDGKATFGWLLYDVEEISKPGRLVRLSASDITLFNPSSRTCPVFLSERDWSVSNRVYSSASYVYLSEHERFGRIDFLGEFFNMTRDARLFHENKGANDLVLYEAKCLFQFDHRYATFEDGAFRDVLSQEKANPTVAIRTKHQVARGDVEARFKRTALNKRWMVGFRSISNPTNERTAIATVFPESGVSNSINLILGLTVEEVVVVLSVANCFVFDYCCRQKISGANVNIWLFKQLPVPKVSFNLSCAWANQSQALQAWLLPRVLELTYTAWDLEPFAVDCGWSGPPFRWDEERRFLLRCELDAAFFHLYGLNRDDTAYIFDTFPIVKRKDEEKYNGDYRTKRVILEIYDAMKVAMDSGKAYQTLLDPPPASIRAAHSFDWSRKPFALPDQPRVAFTPAVNYGNALMLELVFQCNGRLPWEQLRKAWRLLSDLKELARRAEPHFGAEAKKWKDQFNDKLLLDELVDTLSGYCHAGTLWFGERDGIKVVEFRDESDYKFFPHVRCDAQLALAIASTLPPEPEISSAQISALETASTK